MASILFFGPLRDIIGVKDLALTFETTPLLRSDLVTLIAEGHPSIIDALSAQSVRIIADNDIVENDFDLSQSKEIAFLPPMSGG